MAQEHFSVGILLFPGFELLDVFGPAEAFSATCYPGQQVSDGTARPFNVLYLAERAGPVLAGNRGNAHITPDATIYAAPPLDIVMVPGGLGTRTEVYNRVLIDWLREMDSRVQLMTSVCTGAALLAQTGLLEGRTATTNHLAFDWVTQVSPPGIHWTRQLRWVDEGGRYITSAGVSAGTDMACHLVRRLFGPEVAQQTVRGMEYRWDPDPSHQPFTV